MDIDTFTFFFVSKTNDNTNRGSFYTLNKNSIQCLLG